MSDHPTRNVNDSWIDLRVDHKESDGGTGAAIAMKGVHLSFNRKREILSGVDFRVRRGETKVVLGGSGEGKSTILRLALGLLKPTEGSIRIFGEDITHMSEAQLKPIRHRIGMVFQGGALFDSLNVAENVGFCPMQAHGLSMEEAEPLVRKRLEYVGLPDAYDMMPSELSGGMTKRAAVARAMICSPEVILYDEPTTGIDPIGVRRLLKLISRLRDDFQVTSVVVTHILQDARLIADSVAVLRSGKFVFDGSFDELLASPDPFIQEFIAQQQGI
jgi:phospholipid/cholesterol/gamma-HCH transport system ATP-binding protein